MYAVSFKVWAKYLVDSRGGVCSESLLKEIEESMRQAFKQGQEHTVKKFSEICKNGCEHKWNPNMDYMYRIKCGELV